MGKALNAKHLYQKYKYKYIGVLVRSYLIVIYSKNMNGKCVYRIVLCSFANGGQQDIYPQQNNAHIFGRINQIFVLFNATDNGRVQLEQRPQQVALLILQKTLEL